MGEGRGEGIESFPQRFHQPRILFYRQDFTGLFDQQFGQRPQSWPDFQDFVRFCKLCRLDDTAQLIRVVEKVLPEGFRELNPSRRKQLPHFRESHLEKQPPMNTNEHQ
jgi:hypothetical protein